MKESSASFHCIPFGDNALLVEFGDRISLETNRKVVALDNAILRSQVLGVEETVPTYRSLLVRYDPSKIGNLRLARCIRNLGNSLNKSQLEVEGKRVVVPVAYGGQYGPDLGQVAECHELTEEEVVKIHSAREYRVYMIGFVAGFPYLGEVADEIATPRLETPRLKVPAGSIGIAEKQTGIYPVEAPGGWHIIGRTPIKVFRPDRQHPALLNAGDTVRFKQISVCRYRLLREEQE